MMLKQFIIRITKWKKERFKETARKTFHKKDKLINGKEVCKTI